MKTLNYSQLNQEQKEEVSNLIAQMEGQQQNSNPAVRFVARGGGASTIIRGYSYGGEMGGF